MINRRHLRVKALQILYACFKTEDKALAKWEKELLFSVEKTYDLFLYQLSIFQELKYQAALILEERMKKRLPSEKDLNPNMQFVENQAIRSLEENGSFKRACESRKINWNNHQDIMRKLYLAISASPAFEAYLENPKKGFATDLAFLLKIYREYLGNAEILESIYEEKSIYWLDDIEMVNAQVIKLLQGIKANPENWDIPSLFHDQDDKDFVVELFRKTLLNSDKYEVIVSSKTKNWEVDRIAQMDIIIMKMAICELTNFPSIPVKVTLNEYIDLSKYYSTPRSHLFINGVLDKIVAELKDSGEIQKSGRGLLE